MVLIFLDIDGVMLPAKSWEKPELLNDGFMSFDKKAVQAINQILGPGDTIIITSSHRTKYSISKWIEIFQHRGINIGEINLLPVFPNCKSRKEELLHFFENNIPNEDFLIIDDDKSLLDLPSSYKDKLILTSSLIGLHPELVH